MKLRLILLILGLLVTCTGIVRAGEIYEAYQVKPGDCLDETARRFKTDTYTPPQVNNIAGADEPALNRTLHTPSNRNAYKADYPLPDVKAALSETPAASKPEAKAAVKSENLPAPERKPVPQPQSLVEVVSTPKASAQDAVTPEATMLSKAAPAPRMAPAASDAPTPMASSTAKPFLKDYEEPSKGEKEPALGATLFDLVLKLILVLGIAYASIYLLRMLMGRQAALPGRKGHLKVLESASLGPNRSIHLVRVGDEVMVLGSTPDQITTISRIEDPNVLAQLSQENSSRPFSAHLNGALSEENRPELADQVRGGISHLWERVQEVRGLRTPKGGAPR